MTTQDINTSPAAVKRSRDGVRLLAGVAVAIAATCALPMVAVLLAALVGGTDTVRHLIDTVLLGYAGTTLLLVAMVATGTFALGVGTAWLVTMTRFPGARMLEIALVLPLAFPAYVLAYAYTHILDHPGIVQTVLRDVTGWGPRDYWFPEIRSLGGAALMLVPKLARPNSSRWRWCFIPTSTSWRAPRSCSNPPRRFWQHVPWVAVPGRPSSR